MRVGLYFDLRNPPQWRREWTNFYARSLERIRIAEGLGVASIWLTEHHLFEDGYLSQPLTFAGAVAAATSRVRIGTAVVIAPLKPAIDIAEQAAIVDVLSGGRLELGLGAGYRVLEFDAFGADFRRRYELLEERALDVRRLWANGQLMPPPVRGHVPLWIGAQGPRAAGIAGRLGAGLLWLGGKLLKPYAEGLREGGYEIRLGRMAGVVSLLLADDPERAWARIAPHVAYQLLSYKRYGAETRDAATQVARTGPLILTEDVDSEALRKPGPDGYPPVFDVVTPSEAVARLKLRLGSLPVEEIFLWAGVAGMPDDLTDRHIELVATKLAPGLENLKASPLVV